MNKYEIEEEISQAIQHGLNNLVKHSVTTLDVDLSWRNNFFIVKSVIENNVDLIDFFLSKGFQPNFNNNEAFEIAARNNYENIIDKFYDYDNTDPSDNNNLAIITAYKQGYFDLVFKLFKYKEVKESLQKDDDILYNNLLKQATKENILHF